MEIGAATPQTVTLPDPVRRVRTAAPVESEAVQPPEPKPAHVPPPVSSEAIDALAARAAANTRSGTKVRLDDATNRVVVQILNADDEVIRQYPPEELLRVLKSIRELRGLLFDQQA